MKRAARGAVVALLATLVGCRTSHYVVVERGAPLYRGPSSDEVLTWIPRYHHEPLPEAPEGGGRVALTYLGLRGFADRWDVRVFDYLDPALDGGADRELALARALREVQLKDLGAEWPSAHVAEIRAGRVVAGMTRLEVEVAWGWPLTVEHGSTPGTERWVYQRPETDVVPAHEPGWHASGSRLDTVRLPVVVERVVEFDATGRVVRVIARAFVDDQVSSRRGGSPCGSG